MLQRRQQARIVGAVRARLHKHEPAHADPALEGEQIVHRCRAWGVAALGRVREMLGVEDVNVAVAGSSRNVEPRLGWIWHGGSSQVWCRYGGERSSDCGDEAA